MKKWHYRENFMKIRQFITKFYKKVTELFKKDKYFYVQEPSYGDNVQDAIGELEKATDVLSYNQYLDICKLTQGEKFAPLSYTAFKRIVRRE